MFRAIGLVVGLLLAMVIDLLSPKWAYELSWRDLDRALKNQYVYGCNGSLLCLRIGQRRLYVYRDEKGKGVRMGLRIPLKYWEDIFDQDRLKNLGEKFGGWWLFDKWKNKDCFVYFPEDGPDGCSRVLKHIITEAMGGITPNVYGQIDCAKVDIWRPKD